ncbi:MAG: putative oxidoreductase [Gemmatimonadetes bacterium]|nr:putative oxidoreductase [Gemmatimonadota bacterium]
MANKSQRPHVGQRPSVVTSAKRGGPGPKFWVALGLIVVVGIGALSWQASKPKNVASRVDPTLPALKAEGHVMGSPTAKLEVIEFADFECPGCGQFATLTEPDIRTRLVNTGLIRMRYMDFPLSMHKNTWDASFAAGCAGEQGKFWEMHDQIFANQDKWNGEATSSPQKPLAELAGTLGIDMTKYKACVDAESPKAAIQATLAEAEKRGVNQTPTFIIGGQMVPGAVPFDTFKKLVDAELAKTAAGDSAKPADAPTDAKKSATPTPVTKSQ